MKRAAGVSVMFICWMIILAIELLSFYQLTHMVHSLDETLFYITLIFVTVAVGAVGLIIAAAANHVGNNKS